MSGGVTLKRRLKVGLLFAFKLLGGFHLCRRLSRRKLRILCYHGLALEDEYLLDDILFMRPETFRRRMRALKKWRMNVIGLDAAVSALPRDEQPDQGVVITFDDGWFSTLQALPILAEFGFPSTTYVATYYAIKQTSVFNVIIRYLLWKGGHRDAAEVARTVKAGVTQDRAMHERIIRETATRFGIDLDPIEKRRMFHYMDHQEMRALPDSGMAIELHTHRHRFPMDPALAAAEIADNRRALQQVRPGSYEHFCYPSGIFQDVQLAWLGSLGIKSATTTRPGFNTPQTPLLQLNRFLDREMLTDLEFEAEICGVGELWRGRR